MKLLLVKNSFSSKLLVVMLLFGFLSGCQKADRMAPDSGQLSSPSHRSPMEMQESADFVHQWYRFMAKLQLPATATAPPVNYRNFGFIGIGLYESVQPGIKGGSSFSPKLYQMPAMPKAQMSEDYQWSVSANAALASMFKLFIGNLTTGNKASIDSLETANYKRFSQTASHEVLARSEAFGRSIAAAIHNWSATDGFTLLSTGYVPLNEEENPWAWVPTSNPPTIAGAYLGNSRPFLEYSLTATAPPIPVTYSKHPSSEFYQSAKEVYDIGKNNLPEHRATATWWADAGGPGVGLPAPYHLFSIVTSVLESQNAGLWKAAEVYAKAGIGTKDGPIITFRAKYQYNLLRPITFIRRHIDTAWNSTLPAPAYPEYTSGLISNYGPVVQMLISEFGDIAVTDDAYSWRGLPARQFKHLSLLLEEAAVSRVYAGIHYRFTQNVTVAMGTELGNQIAEIQVIGPKYAMVSKSSSANK